MSGTADDKIVFLYGYAFLADDAVGKVVHQLADALRSEGRAVEVWGIPASRVVLSGGGPRARLTRGFREARFLLRAAARVVRQARSVGAVVSVDVPSGVPFVGSLARVISNGRVVDIAWVMDLYRLVDPRALTIRARLERAALRSSGRVVTIGTCMSDRLAEVAHLDSTPIPLWHEPVPTTPATPPVGRPLRLLYSGSARDIHPLIGLVDAVGAETGTELRIAGRGTGVEHAAIRARDRGYSNVEVSGFVNAEDLAESYSWADVHVVSLAEEATGTCVPSKTYAAMSAGRSILYLGSENGQAALDVLAASAGVVAPTGSSSRIEEELRRLLSDPEEVAARGDEARKFAASRRSVVSAASRWIPILSRESAVASQEPTDR
jgi:glycosyltransferase involved in cell wall biosynthesis